MLCVQILGNSWVNVPVKPLLVLMFLLPSRPRTSSTQGTRLLTYESLALSMVPSVCSVIIE